ncbi:MAG TPA: putative peptidoglycan glycosyltransferase FtsW [Patescibacteria group bacterium]|nr:putative peptidoglycan glycosyltransferase FtsW [Patescibacteria group bacterium]
MSKQGILLFFCATFLSILGIFILYESSTYTALLSLSDKYYFVRNQAIWFILGLVALMVVSRIDYKLYYRFAFPMLVVSLCMLVLVFFPGIGLSLQGAHRWLNFGFIVVQPSEILKITLTIYLAAWLTTHEKSKFMAFILLLGLSAFLVLIEPDMGTSFIIAATATGVYFLSGAPIRDLVIIGVLLVVGCFALVKLEPYRVARLTAFQNFDAKDLSKTSYHVKQILISLGSGGLTGVGFGNSVQKYAYLPESTTDSIFAIFAEEAGFFGATILIIFFAIFSSLGFIIAQQARDVFGKLLAAGIITFLGIQAFVNLASQVVLIPLTGVPLPFISYGGSSLIINLVSVGVLLNISRFEGKKVAKVNLRKNREVRRK